jgi:hypothetical protein
MIFIYKKELSKFIVWGIKRHSVAEQDFEDHLWQEKILSRAY